MKSRCLFAAATAFLLCAWADPAGRVRAADAQDTPSATAPFRVAVDLIPVEVQVVDRNSQPVAGLTGDRFEVTIGGRRRKVVSATFIGSTDVRSTGPIPGAAPSSSSVPAAAANSGSVAPPRVFILAVDIASFDQSTVRPVLVEAAAFIRRLGPADQVGLFAYPMGPAVDPTTDRDAVIRALDTVVARRDRPPPGQFNLSPGDLVELSRDMPRTSQGEALEARFCGDLQGPESEQCIMELRNEVSGQVLMYEGIALSGMATLQSLIAELAKVPDRKTLVLVSGGLVSGDMPGTRPDIRHIGQEIGRLAARANVNVYTLFLDDLWMTQVAAETRRAPSTFNPQRDTQVVSAWLGDFSVAAGGSLLRVTSGASASAFERLRAETSGYYLLGVEPLPADRDGRPHELRVRVSDRNLNVRGRSWVVVPKPGAAPTPAAARASTPPASPVAEPLVLATPPSIRALAEAFDRDDRAAIAAALAARNADGLLQAFRESESPWPASPRRTAAFALELAVTGLRTDSSFTRDAAFRLLAEYAVRVRQADTNNPFECTWLWAATAGLAGVFSPDAGIVIAERAVARCPADSNLALARAVARDQQLVMPLPDSTVRLGPPAPMTDAEQRVLALYNAAAGFADRRYEARVRAAYLHYRAGRFADGLALIETLPDPSNDDLMRYLGALVRGQLLHAVGRSDDAVRALRASLVAWPRGQAARVVLMSLLISRGESDEAAALSESVMTAPEADGDPWWVYYLGDYRAYSAIAAHVRELAR